MTPHGTARRVQDDMHGTEWHCMACTIRHEWHWMAVTRRQPRMALHDTAWRSQDDTHGTAWRAHDGTHGTAWRSQADTHGTAWRVQDDTHGAAWRATSCLRILLIYDAYGSHPSDMCGTRCRDATRYRNDGDTSATDDAVGSVSAVMPERSRLETTTPEYSHYFVITESLLEVRQ